MCVFQIPSLLPQDNENCTLVGRWAKGPCYAITFRENFAYIGTGGCFQVFDVSDPDAPQPVGQVILSARIMSMALSGQYVFVATEISGIHLVDVSDPASPVDMGIKIDDFVHKIAIDGNCLVKSSGMDYSHIYDISDPLSPVETGQYKTPGYAYGLSVRDNLAFIADGEQGLRILDVSDPVNPVETAFIDTLGNVIAVAA
ncbi:hypothetical protein JW935_01495 [candidate division KSB1 bacterium]|nr:hypothetical protein [candidate division KSB1 bacterium]